LIFSLEIDYFKGSRAQEGRLRLEGCREAADGDIIEGLVEQVRIG